MRQRKSEKGNKKDSTFSGNKQGYWISSQDAADAVDISLDELCKRAYDPKTPADYADYLHFVISIAKDFADTEYPLEKLVFAINENGCVHPFGIGGHPYCVNFMTWVEGDLHLTDIPIKTWKPKKATTKNELIEGLLAIDSPNDWRDFIFQLQSTLIESGHVGCLTKAGEGDFASKMQGLYNFFSSLDQQRKDQ